MFNLLLILNLQIVWIRQIMILFKQISIEFQRVQNSKHDFQHRIQISKNFS
jgi:hypothetical protein